MFQTPCVALQSETSRHDVERRRFVCQNTLVELSRPLGGAFRHASASSRESRHVAAVLVVARKHRRDDLGVCHKTPNEHG
jgi:hypothetical protein